MSPRDRDDRGRVRIPADVERPDKLLAGLTARQLAILGVAAVALWAGYAGTRRVLPIAVFAVIAIPIAAAATILALARFEGVAADRWMSAAWRHHRSPRRLVPAADGVPPAPVFLAARAGPAPDPLRLPFAGVGADGVVDLGPDGMALVCRASAVTFSLRTPAEQEALVAGFARWLNGLDQPAQILVRAEPVDLTASVDALLDAAPGLPHPALEAASRDHAAFLAGLAARRDLIVSGGANVYPAEVEAAIETHPKVLSSVVVGVPDDDLGQRVHAFVQVKPDVSPEDILQHVSTRLVRYKVPRSVEFIDEPLRDDAGKARRSAMRERATR